MPNVPIQLANTLGAFGLITQTPIEVDPSTLEPDLAIGNLADQRLLGNVSGSTADAVPLTATEVDTFLRGAYPYQFNVFDYGAVADGVTDDTASINSAISAAVTYAASVESCYAEVVFPFSPTPYLLSHATTKGGATAGNAQINIPIVDGTARKVTLVLRGMALDGAAMPHWLQTVGQRWGVTLKSTLTGQTVDSSWGIPSVVGGPATSGSSATYGSGVFNNVALIVENIGISTPTTPTLTAWDMRGMAQCTFRRCSAVVSAATASISGTATNDWTIGFAFPVSTNNDRTVAEDCTCYGFYVGFQAGEHMWANRLAAIYCHDGIKVPSFGGAGTHALAMGSISIEACVDAIRCYDSAGRAPIFIAALSTETISNKHINDSSNILYGTVNISQITGSLAITGGTNLEIISINTSRGIQTSPGLPASTVTLTNPFWRHAAVSIVGGTVTAIKVDGTTVLTTTPGTVIVPSGHDISLTYSDATGLAWKWVTL